jgi:hypothetical protein
MLVKIFVLILTILNVEAHFYSGLTEDEDFDKEIFKGNGIKILNKRSNGNSRSFSFCSADTDCLETHYCLLDKNARGKCLNKKKNGKECEYGLHMSCLSSFCYRKKCREKNFHINVKKNGLCEQSNECNLLQYCNDERCVDRLFFGWCTDDIQCLSKECKFFRCYPTVI